MPRTAEEWDALPGWLRREYELLRSRRACEDPGYLAGTKARAEKRMMRVDDFPADVRASVHAHGLEIVQEFWNHGVKNGRSINYLIDTVRNVVQTPFGLETKFRPNKTKSGRTNAVERTVTVPVEPTEEMIAASLATVCTFDAKITKREKHRRRLRAALNVGRSQT